MTQGAVNFVYQPNQQMESSTAELDPGQSLSLSGILLPDFSGDLRSDLSFVTEKEAAGLVDTNATIVGQPVAGGRLTTTATPITDGVQLDWQSVSGATGYQIWSTAAWPDPIPNPPYLTLTQFGGSPLMTVGDVTQADVTGLTPGATRRMPSCRCSEALPVTCRTSWCRRPPERPNPTAIPPRSRALIQHQR